MATVLLRELREHCYANVYTILKGFPPRLPPLMAPEPMIRFEATSSEQMHVDWGSLQRGPDRLSIFVPTLAWSRAAYVSLPLTVGWIRC